MALFMHLTLVPFIAAAGELKTKPTQHSVKELRSIGIQPDVLLCRSEQPLPDSERRKIALFTNVPEKAVISAVDLDNIYKIPMWLHQQGLDQIVVERLHLGGKAKAEADLSEWNAVVDAVRAPGRRGHHRASSASTSTTRTPTSRWPRRSSTAACASAPRCG